MRVQGVASLAMTFAIRGLVIIPLVPPGSCVQIQPNAAVNRSATRRNTTGLVSPSIQATFALGTTV